MNGIFVGNKLVRPPSFEPEPFEGFVGKRRGTKKRGAMLIRLSTP